MAQEKEIKLDINIPLRDFVSRVQEQGFTKQKVLQQEDIYFDTKDWFLYKHISAFRIRNIKGKPYQYTYKKIFYCPKTKLTWYIDELETSFTNPNLFILEKICDRINVPFKRNVWGSVADITKYLVSHDYLDEQHLKKQRHIFIKDDVEIVIDNVDKIGLIIEIECQLQSPLRVAKRLLDNDEWTRTIIGTNHLWLQKVRGLPSQGKDLKRFIKDPTWNVLSQEEAFYKELDKKIVKKTKKPSK